jgi:hypothetical protein
MNTHQRLVIIRCHGTKLKHIEVAVAKVKMNNKLLFIFPHAAMHATTFSICVLLLFFFRVLIFYAMFNEISAQATATERNG